MEKSNGGISNYPKCVKIVESVPEGIAIGPILLKAAAFIGVWAYLGILDALGYNELSPHDDFLSTLDNASGLVADVFGDWLIEETGYLANNVFTEYITF